MKSKHAVLAAIITLGLAPVCGYPSEWKVILEDSDNVLYVDMQSIAQTGPYVKAWSMVDFKKPQKTINNPSKVYKSWKSLEYFNCSENRFASIQATFYSEQLGNGKVVAASEHDPTRAVYQDAIPDSNGEIQLNYVCAAFRARQSPPSTPKSKN